MKSLIATLSTVARIRSTARPAPLAASRMKATHIITNSRVTGDELLVAVAFLSDALNLPALNPDADRTAPSIDLQALRRAAA